jgi:protein SCO1/2
MTRRTSLIAGLALVLIVLCGAWLALEFTTSRTGAQDAEATSATAAIGGPFTLIDTSGKTVTDQIYRGKWMLIYFGYTYCPDACPTALNNISMALEKLGSDANEIAPLFITVDPKRDTPQVMADYLKSFDPRIVGLTGSPAQTEGAAKAYRVYAAPQKSEGDDYLVDHSSYIYLMNPQGKFASVIPGSASGDEMANKVRAALAHSGT